MIDKSEPDRDLKTGDKAAVVARHNNTPKGTDGQTMKLNAVVRPSHTARWGKAGMPPALLIHSIISNIHHLMLLVKQKM
jgi:cytochrome c551/c552